MIDNCPSCGSSQPHDGQCPAFDGSTVLQQRQKPEIQQERILQGRYKILHVLGQGGMGTVYMAQDLRLKGRNCVVKKLRDDFYREEDRHKAQAFFEREMQVLSDLEHRNIVRISDYFCEGFDYYLVMEYVQGNNLHYMLHEERQGEPFSENSVIEWAIRICDVLGHLHSQIPAVIYRDLKPSNIMIDLKGEPKLVDFGIARPWEEQGEHTHVVSAGYSPPEQYWGQADPRSDIYSLGATMQFLLTGQDPEALHVSSPMSLNPEVSEYTDQIVRKATAQALDQRYQTVEELLEALLHKDYVPAPETPRSRIGEIVTGLILLVVAVFIFLIENMNIGDPNAAKNPPATRTSSEPQNINVDERVFHPSKTSALTGNSGQNPSNAQTPSNQTDLAVQVMDEKDLTDPAGVPEAANKQQQQFGFNLPWVKNGQ